jgi:hypothetical protein
MSDEIYVDDKNAYRTTIYYIPSTVQEYFAVEYKEDKIAGYFLEDIRELDVRKISKLPNKVARDFITGVFFSERMFREAQ